MAKRGYPYHRVSSTHPGAQAATRSICFMDPASSAGSQGGTEILLMWYIATCFVAYKKLDCLTQKEVKQPNYEL